MNMAQQIKKTKISKGIYSPTEIKKWEKMKDISKSKLFSPIKIGDWELKNRFVMAPMTRCFADDQTGVVGEGVVEYYRLRAEKGVGLIITEGILVSPRGKGNPSVPGIYSDEQIVAWKKVTDAVHQEGGKIICQLWHVGRLSHHELLGNLPPLAPSAIRAEGKVPRFRKPYDIPKEMNLEEIQELIQEFTQAAKNAIKAGFDGVEIHGAHGYIIDQFNSDKTNHRTDKYGGNLKQRLTLFKEITKSVIDEIGNNRTLIRFSAHTGEHPSYMWDDPEKAIRTFLETFREVGATMIHPSTLEFNRNVAEGKTMHQLVRKYWDGIIVGVGNLSPSLSAKAIEEGTIDLAAIGRPFIPNPDLIERLKSGEEIEEYEARKHLPILE